MSFQEVNPWNIWIEPNQGYTSTNISCLSINPIIDLETKEKTRFLLDIYRDIKDKNATGTQRQIQEEILINLYKLLKKVFPE